MHINNVLNKRFVLSRHLHPSARPNRHVWLLEDQDRLQRTMGCTPLRPRAAPANGNDSANANGNGNLESYLNKSRCRHC